MPLSLKAEEQNTPVSRAADRLLILGVFGLWGMSFIEPILFSSIFTVVFGYGYRRFMRPTEPTNLIPTHTENDLIRKSPEYREWRLAVLKRDGFKCVWCPETTNLEVDHVYPFAYFPELRFDIKNGRTLCERHHKETITYGTGSRTFYEQLKSRI